MLCKPTEAAGLPAGVASEIGGSVAGIWTEVGEEVGSGVVKERLWFTLRDREGSRRDPSFTRSSVVSGHRRKLFPEEAAPTDGVLRKRLEGTIGTRTSLPPTTFMVHSGWRSVPKGALPEDMIPTNLVTLV